jgi:hypothetical protein
LDITAAIVGDDYGLVPGAAFGVAGEGEFGGGDAKEENEDLAHVAALEMESAQSPANSPYGFQAGFEDDTQSENNVIIIASLFFFNCLEYDGLF